MAPYPEGWALSCPAIGNGARPYQRIMGPPEWIAGATLRTAHDYMVMTMRDEGNKGAMCELIFSNVRIVDPETNSVPDLNDVRIGGQSITEIGADLGNGGEGDIDCGGRFLLPGPIDCHAYSLQPSAIADLILVNDNPLDDLSALQDHGRHIPLFIKNGGLFKNTLEAM